MSSETVASRVALPLRVGTRTVARLHRRLVRLTVPADQALADEAVILPGLPVRADGYYLRAVPEAQLPALAATPGMRAFIQQAYPHHIADLTLGFDAYLARFSAKSRSALKRKSRKLEERCGGRLDVRRYRTPEEVADFHAHARCLSALTYQEQLLASGLPDDLAGMQGLAAQGLVRAFLLFVDGRPVAYLYAPGLGRTLRYEHLGYDPDFAGWSVGSVLQLEAMRALMDEGRFRWFDFTEGDGQHKRLFATASIPSVDLLLLRSTLANRVVGAALSGFDRFVSFAKRIARR